MAREWPGNLQNPTTFLQVRPFWALGHVSVNLRDGIGKAPTKLRVLPGLSVKQFRVPLGLGAAGLDLRVSGKGYHYITIDVDPYLYPSIYLSIWLSIYVTVRLYLSIYLSIYLSLSLSLSLCLSVHPEYHQRERERESVCV